MTVEVWYPLGVAGAGASFAAGGLAAFRARMNVGLLTATAAGALGAIVLLDLVPDVRADAGEAGVPASLLVAVAVATLTALRLAARRQEGPQAAHCGLLGPAFLVHGVLEGLAGGTVIGWQASVGVGLVLALVLHKAAEGADVAAALRGVDAPGRDRVTPSRRAWLIGGAVAPLLGCAATIVLPLPDQLGVAVMTAVCCVLAWACLGLLRRAATSAAHGRVGAAAAIGAATMAAVIALA